MTDIPLDMTPYTNTFMYERRRPDGTLPSIGRDWPEAWSTYDPAHIEAYEARKTAESDNDASSKTPSSSPIPPPPPPSRSAPSPASTLKKDQKKLHKAVESLQEELSEPALAKPASEKEMARVRKELAQEPVVHAGEPIQPVTGTEEHITPVDVPDALKPSVEPVA